VSPSKGYSGLAAPLTLRLEAYAKLSGLLEIDRRRVTLPDVERLMEASLFNPGYLHLGRDGRHLDAND
jgi:hypothetical protein